MAFVPEVAEVSLDDDYGPVILQDVTVPTSVAAVLPEPVDHGEQLATLLETNCASMRRSMMDFYREMKSSMKNTQGQALEAERRTSAAQLNAKSKELEATSTQLTIANDRCAELEGMLLRTATLVATLNLRIRMRRLLAHHFKVWRTALAWGKHERQLYKKAEQWYDIEILQRRVLKRWWFNASVSMKVQARKRSSMVKGLEDTVQQHQDEIKTLEQHLIETRKALVAEKQTREMLAQDMKRSFMRGVCALNLEAMQVMKRGGVKPDQEAGLFGIPTGDPSESQLDEEALKPREKIPENIQNMMSSLNMTMGPGTGPVVPMMKAGNPLAGLAVKEKNTQNLQ